MFLSMLLAFQLVDLNQASLEQLKALDGVGQKMAERILDHRSEKGGFASLEDLLLIQGMKPKLFDKVSKQVVIGRVPKKTRPSAVMSDAEVDELISSYTKEPTVQQVQEEALKYANAHPGQIRSWLARARKAYWLPKFTTGVDPQVGYQETVTEKADSNRNTHDWKLHFRAEWHFNNLIFNQEEIALGREFLRQSLMRERIMHRINEAYFDRRRLQIAKQTQNVTDNQTKIENALKLQELTAELDGLTGGWFSQQL